MEELDLGPIEERLAKATPGPWEWVEGENSSDLGKFITTNPGTIEKLKEQAKKFPWQVVLYGEICDFGNDEQYYPTAGTEPEENDRGLIANAPTDIAVLLIEVKRLREENEDLQQYKMMWVEHREGF